MDIDLRVICRICLRQLTLSGEGKCDAAWSGRTVTTGSAISVSPAVGNGTSFDRAVQLLGGAQHLGRQVVGQLDAHAVILNGMPTSAVTCLLKDLAHLKVTKSIEGAVGFSLRTLQRRRGRPEGLLTPEQGGKIWLFAEVLALATEVLGSQDAAERWLESPVMALDGNQPIDLLATSAGTEMVKELLGRLQYGVYT